MESPDRAFLSGLPGFSKDPFVSECQPLPKGLKWEPRRPSPDEVEDGDLPVAPGVTLASVCFPGWLWSSTFKVLGKTHLLKEALPDYSYACLLSCFSHVWLFAILWTIAPPPMDFPRREYWSGLVFLSPRLLLLLLWLCLHWVSSWAAVHVMPLDTLGTIERETWDHWKGGGKDTCLGQKQIQSQDSAKSCTLSATPSSLVHTILWDQLPQFQMPQVQCSLRILSFWKPGVFWNIWMEAFIVLGLPW